MNNCEKVERGFASKGYKQVLPVEIKRERFDMISAISNRGRVRFMVSRENMDLQWLIRFIYRVVCESGRKVFLILDNLEVHHGKPVSARLNLFLPIPKNIIPTNNSTMR